MIDAGLMRYAVRHSTYCCHCHSLFDKLMISIKTCENKPRSLHLLLSACQQESLFNSAPLKLSQSNSAQLMCMKEQHFYMLSFFLIFFFLLLLFLYLPIAHFLQTSARSSSPHAPWSSGSGWTSRRSSWNSVSRAPSLKRQKRQSGERRSLLSGEGGSSSDEGEGGGEGGGGLMEDDEASLARTDSMSQSQRGPRHRRMESVETRSSMDLPPDTLLQVDSVNASVSTFD